MKTNHRGSTSTRAPRGRWLALALAVAALAVPSAAFAQPTSPTDAQYHPASQQIAATGGGGGEPTAQAEPAGDGSLPFTGLDLGVLAVAAAGLLGAGFALRRLSDPARSQSS